MSLARFARAPNTRLAASSAPCTIMSQLIRSLHMTAISPFALDAKGEKKSPKTAGENRPNMLNSHT